MTSGSVKGSREPNAWSLPILDGLGFLVALPLILYGLGHDVPAEKGGWLSVPFFLLGGMTVLFCRGLGRWHVERGSMSWFQWQAALWRRVPVVWAQRFYLLVGSELLAKAVFELGRYLSSR